MLQVSYQTRVIYSLWSLVRLKRMRLRKNYYRHLKPKGYKHNNNRKLFVFITVDSFGTYEVYSTALFNAYHFWCSVGIKLAFRSPSKHSSTSKEACEMCGQECESRANLQHHLLLQHNILNSFLSSFNLLSPLGQLQQQSQKQPNNQSNDTDRPRNSTAAPGMVTSPINVVRLHLLFFFPFKIQ